MAETNEVKRVEKCSAAGPCDGMVEIENKYGGIIKIAGLIKKDGPKSQIPILRTVLSFGHIQIQFPYCPDCGVDLTKVAIIAQPSKEIIDPIKLSRAQ